MFVRTRLGWIRKQQEKFHVQPRQTEREFVSGETLYVWGKQFFLQVEYSNRGNSLVLSGDIRSGIGLRLPGMRQRNRIDG